MSENTKNSVMGMVKKHEGVTHFTLSCLASTPEDVESLDWAGTKECTEAFEALMRLAQSGSVALQAAKDVAKAAEETKRAINDRWQRLCDALGTHSELGVAAKLASVEIMVRLSPFVVCYTQGQHPDPRAVDTELRRIGWIKTPDGHNWRSGPDGGAFYEKDAVMHLFNVAYQSLAVTEADLDAAAGEHDESQ